MGQLITEFNIPIDRHTIRATDDILAQVMTVVDQNNTQVFSSAERTRLSRDSVFKPNSPYALLRIGNQTVTKLATNGVILEKEVEIVLMLIFEATANDAGGNPVDIQAWGDGLADLTWRALQPQLPDNPGGMVRTPPVTWLWSTDTRFKQNIDRSVQLFTQKTEQLTGSLYSIPLQFKIFVYPTRPLP